MQDHGRTRCAAQNSTGAQVEEVEMPRRGNQRRYSGYRGRCHRHGGDGTGVIGGHCAVPGCRTRIVMRWWSVDIHVSGDDAREVEAVARQLSEDAAARREAARLRSPWFSGLFYLAVLVMVVALLLVAGRVLPLWALPVVALAAALLVSIVGALQMRQDERLSERGFIRLMGDVLRRLPLLIARRPYEPEHRDDTP